MKFCSKCGAELFDDAAICTKCGRMVEGVTRLSRRSASAEVNEKQSMRVTVFNFVFAIMVIMTLFFLSLSFERLVSKWYYYAYDDSVNVPAIMALIFSIASFAFGLVSFILTLVERLREEKLFRGIFNLVLGIALPLFLLIAKVM